MAQPPSKPEVVRHPLPEAHWPTREQAAGSLWFSPLTLGPITARRRTWVPAMVPWRASDEGFVTEDVLDWYGRFAKGRPGVLVVEATGIRDVPSGPLLRIGHDRFIPGLQKLTEVVRDASHGETRLLIQTIDFLTIRRRPEKEKFFRRFLTLTERHRAAVPEATDDMELRATLAGLPDETLKTILSAGEWRDYAFGYRETINDLHLPHVKDLPQVLPGLFATAAERAQHAGFDGVELHFAHAYTMASFLSRLNERNDGYGGSREARVRLPVEVLQAVRQQVGTGFCVGLRLLGDEAIEGGSTIGDACYSSVQLADAGADFISVSKGGKFEDAKQPHVGEAAYPYTGPSGHECMPVVRSDARGPFGRNVPLAAAIRAVLRGAGFTTPVITSGGICTFEQGEEILRTQAADAVASARQSLADPDWFLKMELGLGDSVRRCKFTNYCEGLDQKHKQVTCQRWDRDFSDDTPTSPCKRSKDGKRRLVAPDWDPPPDALEQG